MNNDLISRQAAIEACLNGWNYDMETIKHIQDNISRLPSVQLKTGRWINIKPLLTAARCSECKSAFADKTNYCPKCGAKMKGEAE